MNLDICGLYKMAGKYGEVNKDSQLSFPNKFLRRILCLE